MAEIYKIEDKKILFIHIPKTGGRSIGTTLSQYKVHEPRIFGHANVEHCLKFVKPDYIFTVVRNPWDWRASWFHYIKEGTSGHIYEYNNIIKMSFKDHIKWIENEPINNFSNSNYDGVDLKHFIMSQSDYINDEVKVLRFENLKNDFDDFMVEIGSSIKLETHIGKSTNKNYIKEYDDESIKIVEKLSNSDIVKFGYKF
jgi:hypothetical protein